jgi:hypothetical protein
LAGDANSIVRAIINSQDFQGCASHLAVVKCVLATW